MESTSVGQPLRKIEVDRIGKWFTELMRCESVVKCQSVILLGNPGSGKTHLATALAIAACHQGKRVRF